MQYSVKICNLIFILYVQIKKKIATYQAKDEFILLNKSIQDKPRQHHVIAVSFIMHYGLFDEMHIDHA